MVVRIPREQVTPGPGQNEAMTRAVAISSETAGSVGLYSGVVTTAPGGRTEVHHHGRCETSIYILRGRARFYSGDGLGHVTEAEEGDFVYVPAFEVHVEENASATAELVVVITRNCPGPETYYVEGAPVGSA